MMGSVEKDLLAAFNRERSINAELVEACKAVLADLGEPATWKDVCPEHHQQLIDIVAKVRDEDGEGRE